jgi:hypothetical protein
LEGDDKTEAKTLEKARGCYWNALESLAMLVYPVAKEFGYELRLRGPIEVLRDGVTLISYQIKQAVNDPTERKRVLDFWTDWCRESGPAVAPPDEK